MQHGIIHLVLELIKRYFPAKATKIEPYAEPINVELALKVYKKWLIPTYVLMVIWVVGVTYFGGQVAAQMTKYLIQLIYKDAIIINFAMVWYLIMGFISLVYFQNFFNWFIIKIMDEQTLMLLNYGSQLKADYNAEAVMPLLKKVVFAFVFIIFILAGFIHLRLYNDRFVIGNLVQSDKVYPFNQIASITHAQKVHYSNDEDRIRPLIEIKMKNNSTWESNDFDIEKDSLVFKLIAQGANLKIDSVPLIYKPRYH